MTKSLLRHSSTWCTVLVVVIGCGRGSGGSASPRDPGAAAERSELRDELYFVLRGAPDPVACAGDDECVADTVVASDGCCVGSPTPRPQTRAWHRWIGERRMSDACSSAACETPNPSVPAACYFEVACIDGRCQTARPCPGAIP